MAIGEYDGFPNLPGTKLDYENAIDTFVGKWQYNILYQLNDGQFIYSNDLAFVRQNNDFKLKWNVSMDDSIDCKDDDNDADSDTYNDIDDIGSFAQRARQYAVSNEHDGLIFIISGHGDSGNIIYDSDCGEYKLDNIFNVFKPEWYVLAPDDYQETAKNHLFKMPKIFFIDCCRGQEKAVPFEFDKNEDSCQQSESENDSKSDFVNESESEIDSESESESGSQESSLWDDSKEEEESKSQSAITMSCDSDESDESVDSSDQSESAESNSIITKGCSQMTISKEQSNRVFAEMSNFSKIYATAEGYSVGDSTKGGLFLNSVYQVFNDVNFVSTHTWDDIVLKIREYTKRHATKLGNKDGLNVQFTQMVESEGTLEKRLRFETNFQDSDCMELEELEPKQITITNFSLNERIAVLLETEENREDFSETIEKLCATKFEDAIFKQIGFKIIDPSGYNNGYIFDKTWNNVFITILVENQRGDNVAGKHSTTHKNDKKETKDKNRAIRVRWQTNENYLYFHNDLLLNLSNLEPKCQKHNTDTLVSQLEYDGQCSKCNNHNEEDGTIFYKCQKCNYKLCEKCCHSKLYQLNKHESFLNNDYLIHLLEEIVIRLNNNNLDEFEYLGDLNELIFGNEFDYSQLLKQHDSRNDMLYDALEKVYHLYFEHCMNQQNEKLLLLKQQPRNDDYLTPLIVKPILLKLCENNKLFDRRNKELLQSIGKIMGKSDLMNDNFSRNEFIKMLKIISFVESHWNVNHIPKHLNNFVIGLPSVCVSAPIWKQFCGYNNDTNLWYSMPPSSADRVMSLANDSNFVFCDAGFTDASDEEIVGQTDSLAIFQGIEESNVAILKAEYAILDYVVHDLTTVYVHRLIFRIVGYLISIPVFLSIVGMIVLNVPIESGIQKIWHISVCAAVIYTVYQIWQIIFEKLTIDKRFDEYDFKYDDEYGLPPWLPWPNKAKPLKLKNENTAMKLKHLLWYLDMINNHIAGEDKHFDLWESINDHSNAKLSIIMSMHKNAYDKRIRLTRINVNYFNKEGVSPLYVASDNELKINVTDTFDDSHDMYNNRTEAYDNNIGNQKHEISLSTPNLDNSITQQDIDFLEMIICSPNNSIENGLPKYDEFVKKLKNVDKMVRELKLKPNYYHLYLQASLNYRKSRIITKYLDDFIGRQDPQLVDIVSASSSDGTLVNRQFSYSLNDFEKRREMSINLNKCIKNPKYLYHFKSSSRLLSLQISNDEQIDLMYVNKAAPRITGMKNDLRLLANGKWLKQRNETMKSLGTLYEHNFSLNGLLFNTNDIGCGSKILSKPLISSQAMPNKMEQIPFYCLELGLNENQSIKELIKSLFTKNEAIFIKCYANLPIHLACFSNSCKVLQNVIEFIDNSNNINEPKTDEKWLHTPLMIAVANQNGDVLSYSGKYNFIESEMAGYNNTSILPLIWKHGNNQQDSEAALTNGVLHRLINVSHNVRVISTSGQCYQLRILSQMCNRDENSDNNTNSDNNSENSNGIAIVLIYIKEFDEYNETSQFN